MVRALAAAGVLGEPEPRLFALTPLGARLRRDGEESVHGYVLGSARSSAGDDDHAVAVLSRCREAIEPDGRVLLVERVIGSDGEHPMSALLGDLHMLVMFGGRERTAGELGALLAAAGFKLTQVTPFRSPYAVVEGRCGPP